MSKYYVFAFSCLLLLGAEVKAKTLTLPTIEHWTTHNNVPVYLVFKPQLPIIDIGLLFHVGTSQDNASPGVAQFTAQLLDQGTRTLSADQIANRFESVGALYSTVVTRDMTILNLRSLSSSQFFNPAFNNFFGLIKNVLFPQEGINRIKKQTLVILKQEAETPSAIALKAFYSALYGQHPYASPRFGTPESIEHLTRKKILTFYHDYYTASNALIVMVGNISRDKATSIAEQLSSLLSRGKKTQLPTPTPLQPINHPIKISYPSQQTTLLLGQLGISVNDPDYFPFLVGNQILGGGILTSRLFLELRDKRGLCYGVSSSFKALQEKGPFLIALQTRKKQAWTALTITQKTLKNFITQGPSAKELQSAKQTLTGSFPLFLASNESTLETIEKIAFYHLPLNYLDNYIKKINAVTLDQIRQAFQRLKIDRMVIIMVG